MISTVAERLPQILTSMQITSSDLKLTMEKMQKLPKYIQSQIISEVEKIAPSDRKGLELTIAKLYLGAGKVEKDVELFDYYGYSGNIPVAQKDEENPKDFRIKAKVLYAKTAEGKEDKRLLAGQGTKCATGDYKMDRLYFILYKMAKLALSRVPPSLTPMQLVESEAKPKYDLWSESVRNQFNKIKESVMKDRAQELVFEYIISMKRPSDFFKDASNVKQFDKIKDKLASKDKKSFENLVEKAQKEKLEDNEIQFVLEKIPFIYFALFNTKIKGKLTEEAIESELKSDFKTLQNDDGYSLEMEMKSLFGNSFDAKNLCSILRNWFKEVNLLEEN